MARRYIAVFIIFCFMGATASAGAQTKPAIPDIAQALLNAAYETDNPEEIKAVTKAVKAVFPDYVEAIEAQSVKKVAALAPPEAAQPSPKEDEIKPQGGVFAVKPWDGKINVSAAFSSGNSENSAVGIAINTSRTAGDFVHNVKAYFDLGESGGVTNQKRWGGAYQLDYKFSDATYVYGRLAYDEDEFSGFDYRLFAGAGLGHYISLDEAFKWKVEGGPGFRYSPVDATREIDQQLALYGASELDWVIREGLVFEQDSNVTWTSPTTTYQAITSLSTKLFDGLSTGVSFEYRYETNPPLGRKQTDTITRANLIYGF